MNRLRMAVAIAVAIAVTGIGHAGTPAAHGQGRVVQVPQVLDVFVGGSRIGVSIRDVEAVDAQKAGVAAAAGVLVEEVTAGSPADEAGIRKGDLIVEFDGERVRSARQLTRLVHETPAGRPVSAAVLRDGQRTALTVTPSAAERGRFGALGAPDAWAQDLRARVMPRAPAPPVPPPPPPPSWSLDELVGTAGPLGLTVRSLSPQLAEYFGADEGVLVSSVADDSAAAKAGVKAGDVMTAVNGAAVRAPADARRLVQNLADGDEFTLSVVRDRKPLTLKGTAERTSPRRTVRTTV